MTVSFSDQLLALARPNLAWVCEQLDLFDSLVPAGVVSFDRDEPSVTRSGITLRAHVVGTYALDGTWMWAWANESYRDSAIAARSLELRELGERAGVPELTEPMPDLNHFPDPRLAADHLLLMCVGLLDARGAVICAVNERGRLFMVVDDPAVPRAEPRAARLATALRNGAAMLPGPALKPVKGWFARHGVEPEYAPGRVEGALDGGDRVVVRLEGEEVTGVEVTGADGGAPRCGAGPEQRLEGARLSPGAPHRVFPRPLLGVAAREIALSVLRTRAMVRYAGEHLDFDGRPPVWDEEAGELRFPGGGLKGRRLGSYDAEQGWFLWAPGTEDVRDRFREAAGLGPADAEGLPELSGERLDLTVYGPREAVAVALARTAANVAGHTFTSLGNDFFAVTDERLSDTGPVDLDGAVTDLRGGASWLHGLVEQETRDDTMRTLARSYFERLGLQVWHYGQPDFLSGVTGLYEVRVYFAPDGTITHVEPGMLMGAGR
ncbi:DUF6882 domain-containing protein [Streptomyces sp. enrichment culture]|uniref:DUF6882 domain-containing protein n=1 Tax=Streptomyces sp. enrichment culture TaxID=1795815 RepID=UPI003F548340